jgi:hypothetical protein
VKNTLNIAPVGCKQPLGVICGPERHLFKTDGYLKMPPVEGRFGKVVTEVAAETMAVAAEAAEAAVTTGKMWELQ